MIWISKVKNMYCYIHICLWYVPHTRRPLELIYFIVVHLVINETECHIHYGKRPDSIPIYLHTKKPVQYWWKFYKLSVVTLLLWLQEVRNISWYLTEFCILSSRWSYLCAIYVCYSLSQRKRLWEICEMTYWWNNSCNSKYWIMCITHCDILPWWIVRELVKVPSVYVIFHLNVTDVTFISFLLTIHECS